LPKTVGVESDGDLLCVELARSEPAATAVQYSEPNDFTWFRDGLSAQLPAGLEILHVDLIKTKSVPKPVSAVIVFPLKEGILGEKLRKTAGQITKIDELYLDRRIDENGNTRRVNVAGFIESVEINDGNPVRIAVKYRISPAGSIRVDEIMKLLKIDCSMLSAPIRRTAIQWQD